MTTLLLSVDFEDWHQLVRRRVGAADWRAGGPALPRQADALFELLDSLHVRATFFILGMAARAHPDLVAAIARRGHEIACHGDEHLPVHSQRPSEFAADLANARRTIEELTGVSPIGYRAPAFSITRSASWALDALADAGFAYDSSLHDSPRIRDRIVPAQPRPHRMTLGGGRTLWEMPVAVWRAGSRRIPVGGASYWGVMPTRLVLHGLAAAGPDAGLYLHPHELDPQPLRAQLPAGASPRQRAAATMRVVQRESARRGAADTLRAISRRFSLITYGECHAALSGSA